MRKPSPITLISFGFLHVDHPRADVVFDIRERLRDRAAAEAVLCFSGVDVEVQQVVRSTPGCVRLLHELADAVHGLTPGRPQRVAVGCGGGRHRAPAVCELLAQDLRGRGGDIAVEHRHLQRPVLLASRQPYQPGWRVEFPAGGRARLAIPFPPGEPHELSLSRALTQILHVFRVSTDYQSAQVQEILPSQGWASPTPITLVLRHNENSVHVVGNHGEAERLRTLIEQQRDHSGWHLHAFTEREFLLTDLTDVLGGRVAHALRRAGFRTLDEALQAPARGLLQMHGIGPAVIDTLTRIIPGCEQ